MSLTSNISTDNFVQNEDFGNLGEEILPQAAQHCVTSFAAMNEMRKNSQLCDVTLEIDEETLHAHKVVLASASPYFYAMFNNDMLERTQRKVRLHDLDLVGVKHLIDYIYTGQITITEHNVQVLLSASSLLQIHTVREGCSKFLMRHLLPSNCLSIRSIADTHSCKELHTKSHKYVLQNFQPVAETEEFLLLPYEEVRDLISNNALYVCIEEKVFNAVLNWIKHDLAKRQKHIAELMSHVRLPLVNREFLMTTVETEPLMRDDSHCRELLMEAIKYHLLPEQRNLMCSQRTQERKPDVQRKPYIFAIGGNNQTTINHCEAYNPRSNTWSTIAPMLSMRKGSGVTALNNRIYVVGGDDKENFLNTVECYNPSTNKWSYTTPMVTKRAAMGICTFNGLMYVCGGGSDDVSDLSTAVCYDPLTTKWKSIRNMKRQRSFCRLAVLDNCIYCCGGKNAGMYLSVVERFDPRIGRWYTVPSMRSQRGGCGVASCDSFLYCIGGYDGNIQLSSGERFNPRTNSWEPIAAMHYSRSAHEVVEVEGSLYALGGYDGSSYLNSVERYDISLNTWTTVSSMTIARSSVGAAVLDCMQLVD